MAVSADAGGILSPRLLLRAVWDRIESQGIPEFGTGDRKSVQPMAAHDGEVGYDQLHHFIASGVWDAAPLEKQA
jgi:DDE superfamily endonuclease